MVVGEQTDGIQSFMGEMSLVQVFDRIFTDQEFSEMLVDCPTFSKQTQTDLIISWKDYTTG